MDAEEMKEKGNMESESKEEEKKNWKENGEGGIVPWKVRVKHTEYVHSRQKVPEQLLRTENTWSVLSRFRHKIKRNSISITNTLWQTADYTKRSVRRQIFSPHFTTQQLVKMEKEETMSKTRGGNGREVKVKLARRERSTGVRKEKLKKVWNKRLEKRLHVSKIKRR